MKSLKPLNPLGVYILLKDFYRGLNPLIPLGRFSAFYSRFALQISDSRFVAVLFRCDFFANMFNGPVRVRLLPYAPLVHVQLVNGGHD